MIEAGIYLAVVRVCVKCGSTERNTRNNCKPCVKTYNAAWKAANPEKYRIYKEIANRQPLTLSKPCKKCNGLERTSDGKCKVCRADYVKNNADKYKSSALKWRKSNTDAINEYQRAYRQSNPLKVLEAHRIYRIKNPLKILASSAATRQKMRDMGVIRTRTRNDQTRKAACVLSSAHYIRNKDKISARMAAYHVKNPDKAKVWKANRRARLMGNGGQLSCGLADKLFSLQSGLCPCCRAPLGDDYHMDHIMPLALGGSNTDDNIQLLRQTCNMQKHAKHPVDFMQSRGFLL